MRFCLEQDSTWDTALKISQTALNAPSSLARLVRSSWIGSTNLGEFNQTLKGARLSSDPIIHAAKIITPDVNELDSAITTLGFKGSSSVVAINFATSAVTSSCDNERLREIISQRLIDTIEVGFHLGVNASAIGPDSGMLLGFAQSIGCAILATSPELNFNDARAIIEAEWSNEQILERFNCEPYQVASLALQRLGYGSQLASAAVTALGGLASTNLSQQEPLVRDWCAASDWIAALFNGEAKPKRRQTAEHFSELLFEPSGGELPLHFQALKSSVDEVRSEHSAWRWHLANCA